MANLDEVRKVVEARRAAQANHVVLRGASEGGVQIQPSTTVNTKTGQTVNTPVQQPAVPKPTTPTPTAQPTNQPVNQPTAQPTATPAAQPAATPQSSFAGLDETALKASGITDDQIAKMKAILSPSLQANQNIEQRAGELYTKTTADLENEQKQTEQLYNDVKTRKEQLANESLQINDQSAEVQKMLSDQQYQQTKFLNEQAKAQFELDATRAERERQTQNDENEAALRRAIGAQLGASFASEGLNVMLKEKSRGAALIDDLRAQNAIGRAEFSFKAIEIEKTYYSDLKSIETDRASKALTIKSQLDQDLTDIDEQILLSRSEKKQAARDAMKSYYEQLNAVEADSAAKTTEAVNKMYDEKKALEKEKLEKETFNLEQSTALGYYANKYGQPIGIPEGGRPKPFVGQFDENLSKQFGYLVDSQGHAIKGSNGQNITYKDPDLIAFQSALSGYQNGDYNQNNLSALNFRLGTNNAIATTLKSGVSYPSAKYGSLQCGEYINDYFLQSRELGSYMDNANQLITKYGGKPGSFAPQVGDVVFMDYNYFDKTNGKEIPHKAIIEGMDEQGNLVLTDANFVGAGVVRHGWKIPVGSDTYKKIIGFARLPLKDNIASQQPALTPNLNGTDATSGGGSNRIMDNFVVSYDDYKKLSIKEKRLLASKYNINEQSVKDYFEKKSNPTSSVDQALDIAIGSPEEYKAMANTVDGRKTLQELRQKYGNEAIDSWLKGKQSSTPTIPADMKTKLQADPSVKKVKAANDFNLALNAYRDLVDQAPGTEIWGENKTKLDSAYANLKVQFKNAAELGAIAAADVPLIEASIKPITKDAWDVAGRIQIEQAGGKNGVLASIDQALKLSNERKDQAMSELDSLYPEFSNTDYFSQLRGYTPGSGSGFNFADMAKSGLSGLQSLLSKAKTTSNQTAAPTTKQTVSDDDILNALK